MTAAIVDHSDQYLYWDNVETATIDLREFWDQNDQAYEPRQYADVIKITNAHT